MLKEVEEDSGEFLRFTAGSNLSSGRAKIAVTFQNFTIKYLILKWSG
jgi:hypothetical protein